MSTCAAAPPGAAVPAGRIYTVADIAAGRPVAVATIIEHPDRERVGRRLVVHPAEYDPPTGSLGSERIDAAVARLTA